MSDRNIYDKAFDLLLHEALSEVESEENVNLPDELDVDFSDEHKAKMKKIFDRERKKIWRKKVYKTAQRIAACAAVFIVISGITIMSVDAWRIRFLNFVFNNQQTNTEISMTSIPEENIYETDTLLIGYIPDRFTLTKNSKTDALLYLNFDNGANQIRITVVSSDTTTNIDTEDAVYEEMLINDNKALYAEKNGQRIVVICTYENVITIQGDISKDEIIKVAQNLKNK